MKYDDERKPPVRVGDELTLKCKGIGSKGDGVFKKDGYTIFAPNTEEGKTYELRMTRILPTVGFAEVITSS